MGELKVNKSEEWDLLHGQFLTARFEFLKDPSDEKRAAMMEVAQAADRLNKELHSKRINFSEGLDEQIKSLLAKDKVEWALLLNNQCDNHKDYDQLKLIAPFEGALMTTISFDGRIYDGQPTVVVSQSLARQLINAIEKLDLPTDNGMTYFISLDLKEVVQVPPNA